MTVIIPAKLSFVFLGDVGGLVGGLVVNGVVSVLQANKDVTVLHFVSKILKEVVPLMEHPNQDFLAGLEEDLVKLIMKQGQFVSPMS